MLNMILAGFLLLSVYSFLSLSFTLFYPQISFKQHHKTTYSKLNERKIRHSDVTRLIFRGRSGNDDIFSFKQLLSDIKNQKDEPLAVVSSKLPTIAIIGRPNTGKSTIANKICDDYVDGSIVHDEAGVTRDRVYRNALWNGYNFRVVDTGGIVFEDDPKAIFTREITHQALVAFEESVAAIFVCDGLAGITPLDQDVAAWLRKRQNDIPIYVAINKCESETKGIEQAEVFKRLGLGYPYPVSGIHGTGIGDLLDVITAQHMKKIKLIIPENITNVAFIGRPNVGKSSLFNKIYGQNRSIVSEVPGTTRDTIDAIIIRENETFRIVDTAGIRKKNKIDYGTEFFMINR